MKQFKNFVKKEFLHIFRDTKTLFILFALPVIQLVLFGFALTNEVKDVNFAVYDKSKTEFSTKLINKVDSSKNFTLKQMIYKESDIDKLLIANKVKLILVIDEDFASGIYRENESSIQLIIDAVDPNIANTIKGYITSIINDFSKEELTPYAKNPFEIAIRMLYNPELKSVYMFIPGLMAFILTLISAFMTSITLTKEKELGNMEILLISPLKPYQIIVGKVIPYAILSIFNIGTILGFGKYLFNMPFNGSILLLWAESILFLFSALALGIMISSFTSSRQVAMMASLSGLLLPTLLLSGFIFPIANMPNVLQYFTYIVPAKYFITIIKSIMIKGNGFEYIISETLALAGFTLLFVLISIKKFNVRLDK